MAGIASGILAIAPRKSTQAWSVALAMLVLVAVLRAGLAETVTTMLCTRSLTLGSGASLTSHRMKCPACTVAGTSQLP